MKKIFLITIILCVFVSTFHLAQASSPPYIPSNKKLLIIGQQMDSIDGYLDSIGIVPGGFMFYTSIQNVDGLDAPADHGAGVMYAQDYIDRYPNTVVQLGLYMVGALDNTLKGRYNKNIKKLAKWLKKTNRPVYLRIGYEFDLPQNGYDPIKYQKAYRYIVDQLRSQGVTNVAYVWHSACLTEATEDYMDWYPGDDYVDWFAISLFNPMQIAKAKIFGTTALAHLKPLMIAESTPAGLVSTEAKKEWFKHYFDFIKEEDVRIVCYINSNWNTYPMFKADDWGDAQIQDDPEIKDIWIKKTKNGAQQSSPDLFDKLNGIYP